MFKKSLRGALSLMASVAFAHLFSVPSHADGLIANYYNSINFTGTPTTRLDPTVNFDWGQGSPVAGFNTDKFSARWTGFVQAPATGNYSFSTYTDDGVRLWVNNTLLVDKWVGQPPTVWSQSINLSAGQKVPIRLDFFEDMGGAVAKLSWSGPGVSSGIIPAANLLSSANTGDGLSASYFNSINLSGTPVKRLDPRVNFDWGTASPVSGIGSDNFSARWSGYVLAPNTGTYSFTTTTDDGARLWVNNTLLVDKWVGQPPTSWSGSINLTAGQRYPLKMEFYDGTGGASARLSWSGPGVASGIVPQSNLFSDGGANVPPGIDHTLFGVNLAGGDFQWGKVPATYGTDYSYPSLQDVDYFKSKGRRLIRLPFHWNRVQPTLNGPLASLDVDYIDKIVARATAQGMTVILDCHNYGWRKVGDGPWPGLGDAALPNSAFADLWKRIAQRYATSNVAYDLMNEPSNLADDSRWPAAAQEAVNAIRTVDTVHTIFVEGDHQSGAHSWRTFNENLDINDPANNLVYQAHCYFDDTSGEYRKSYDEYGATPQTGVERVRPFVEWCKAKGKRGFIGEFGVPNNDPRWLVTLDNFLAYLQANNIGGTYWAGGERWAADYVISIQPTNNYTVDRPTMGVLQKYPG